MSFSTETYERAQEIKARYPAGRERSALLPLLHLVQAEEGYVTPRGVAFCAEARPVVESVIRLADSNVMARRIWFLPLSAIQLEADVRLVLCRDSIVTTGREPDRGRRNAFPRHDLCPGFANSCPSL